MGHTNNSALISMEATLLLCNDMVVLPTTKTQYIYQPLFLARNAHISLAHCPSLLIATLIAATAF
jgi:hypothetical protein